MKLFRGEYEATVYDASGNELGATTFDVNNDPRNGHNLQAIRLSKALIKKIFRNEHLRDICY